MMEVIYDFAILMHSTIKFTLAANLHRKLSLPCNISEEITNADIYRLGPEKKRLDGIEVSQISEGILHKNP